eukprot:CAMPEP_0194126646 /NCGR_PEP_ID=MMETSP0150-20130528/60100_1 /TAXON_ID=122233 /ORGANISM="Chaetoceros debilis, Strain MM31A-1" /LENGTH=634 /DNA_ID=CAMNT_0038820519 /DNA_START=44 /DNA_END=1948 /DNA_ORIENTATION=-
MATDNKYDRQLRLWGTNGQKALSECCIVLINATACGTETLKNLVLPGIGRFHIIDDAMMKPKPTPQSSGSGSGSGSSSSRVDPFSNFFVFPGESETESENDSEYRSRAEVAKTHLSELNPDVRGSFTAVESLVTADYAGMFSNLVQDVGEGHLLVICADLPPSIVKNISSICWNGIGGTGDGGVLSSSPSPCSLVIVKSYGLIGSVRVQTPYHPIVESKPDNTVPDLRLAQISTSTSENGYFAGLKQVAEEVDLDKLDSQQHGHVPYVIILLKAVEQWRGNVNDDTDDSNNENRLPKTMDEKAAFKEVIKSLSKNWNNEMNFHEASENAYLAYATQDIPWEVQELLNGVENSVKNKTDKSSVASTAAAVTSFDVLLLALKRFVDKHKLPPLNGSIPDMTSSTQSYIQLQGLYKNKAESDKEDMRLIIKEITCELGAGTSDSGDIPTVTDDDLSTFCKNIFNLRLTKTRSYEDEYNVVFTNDEEKEEILGELAAVAYDPYEVKEHTPFLWYIVLKAVDHFYEEHGHYPGNDSRQLALDSDAKSVQKYIHEICKQLNLEENDLIASTLLCPADDDLALAFAKEMTRYHNAEIHNTASVVGGVASQEAVKLITAQYVPMDGTYLFNGITSVAGVYKA